MARYLREENDHQGEKERMNSNDQAWLPIDLAAENLPQEIEGALGNGDSPSACVVVLVDSEIDPEWGAQVSLTFSKRWAASGYKVILADGCLDDPVLHEAVGVENGEGVSDMVLYGASIPRIAGRVGTRLVLASAGTPVVQIAEVMEHVRWDMVIRGCRGARATLVFHTSTGTPGVEAMTQRADGVLVLAPASRDVSSLLGSASGSLLAVLGPGNGDAPFLPRENEEAQREAAPVDVITLAPEDEEVRSEALDFDVPPEALEDEEAGEEAPSELAYIDVLSDVLGKEAEDSLGVEVVAAPTEDEDAAFSLGDLPGLASNADEDVELADAFSMTGLQGEQYDASDSTDVESDSDAPEEDALSVAAPSPDAGAVGDVGEGPTDVETGAEDEVGYALVDQVEDAAADLEGAPADFDAVRADHEDALVDVDAMRADLEQAPLDFEISDETPFEIEGSAIVDEEEQGAQAPQGGEPAGADPRDFGALDLGVDEATAAAFRAKTAIEGPDPTLDALRPDERVAAAAEEAGAARRTFGGLARLEGRRKRAVLARQFMTGVATILIVGGGGVGLAYFGVVNIPGITPPDRVRAYAPAPMEIPGPMPQTAVMSHVLMIDSWRASETATATAEALKTRLPELVFFVTPLDVAGTLQFALQVGPAYSAVEAEALKDPVAAVLDRLDPNDWEVREAPYAFFFGSYSTAGIAEGRVRELAAVSVPAYALQVEYPDGTTGFRAYGGAYSDEYQASEMGRIVSDGQVGDMVLTARRGAVPE
jgi:hypothetical protein